MATHQPAVGLVLRRLAVLMLPFALVLPPAVDAQDPVTAGYGCTLIRGQRVDIGARCKSGNATACAQEPLYVQALEMCESTVSSQEACDERAHTRLLDEVECRRNATGTCERRTLAPPMDSCTFTNEDALRRQVGLVEGGALPTEPVMQPQDSRHPVARYPLAAFKNGIEGQVTLRVDVSAEGGTTGVGILRSSRDRDLDRSAMEWMRTMRFTPAKLEGAPVIGRLLVPVSFVIGGRAYSAGMGTDIPALPPVDVD